MFIIVNNRPLNIFRIKRVNGIIPLDLSRYKFTVETILDGDYENYRNSKFAEGKEKYENISTAILKYVDKTQGVKGTKRDNGNYRLKSGSDLDKNKLDKDGNLGYYFVIWMLDSGAESYVCSSVYEKEADAEEAMRHFLATVNEVTYSLPNIKI